MEATEQVVIFEVKWDLHGPQMLYAMTAWSSQTFAVAHLMMIYEPNTFTNCESNWLTWLDSQLDPPLRFMVQNSACHQISLDCSTE